MANCVARVQVLLDLINELSGVVVKVKKNGQFYKKIYFSKLYGRITREITGKSSWSKIGKFEDFLPSAFVGRPTNNHLVLYYGLPMFQFGTNIGTYMEFEIEHQLALPCEICGKNVGDCEVDGRRLSAMNSLCNVSRAVECCKLCKKIYDQIDMTNTWDSNTMCYCDPI